VAEDAVLIEPVFRANSLLTGKLTGKFAVSGLPGAIFAPDQVAESIACTKIPYSTEQGFFNGYQGRFARQQGICTADLHLQGM
jgi:hypothetical protein